jgi:hypothetical protein
VGVAISGLVAGTVINEADVFEIEQAGVSKKITKTQLRSLMFSDPAFVTPATIPQEGDVVSYNGTDFISRGVPRWRKVHQDAYTEAAVASSSTITFAGGATTNGIRLSATDLFDVGSPVQVVISGTSYYGICTAVTTVLLTLSGAILPTATAITSLWVGRPSAVKHVTISYPATGYNGSTSLVLPKGCIHRWRGRAGYLVAYSCSHMNTSATTVVQLQMNGGSNVSTAGVIPAAGVSATVHGAFTDSALGDLIAANLLIEDKQTITATTPTAGGSADFLIIDMTFVIP